MSPREVPTIVPMTVPVKVTPSRVPATAPPTMLMIPRSPIISHEDPIEDSSQRDTFEHNNKHERKHKYPARITQLSQELNQVESAETTSTRHQNWLMNIHEQVKATPKVIDNYLKYNAIRILRKVTQHDHLSKIVNTIIDEDTKKS